jgi:hypothetical protein
MKQVPLAILLVACASHPALASENDWAVFDGCYEVRSGYVETLATTLFTDANGFLRQQGTFSASFKSSSKNRPKTVSKQLKIKGGVVVGELAPTEDNPLNILHTLTNEDGNGVIVSSIGTLVSQIPASQCVLEVTEVLEDFSGFGVYEGLDPLESFIVVEGDVNLCNGQNTFDVTEGRLCFF